MKNTRSFAARMHSARLTEVRRSSSMMPILTRMARQAERVLDAAEQLVGEGDFFRPVHLGLDDIDRAGAAVPQPAQALQVVKRDQAGEHGVEHAFGRLLALDQNRVAGHQMADIAHQQQARGPAG